jgi:hypothetical protein
MLQTTYPLLSAENIYLFPYQNACGIHCHGAGKAASDFGHSSYLTGSSPYTMQRIVEKKFNELREQGVPVATTKADSINAVEDLLCDEYALEFAFEGNRWFDLCRLARHKNAAALYGSDYGSLWLSRKLAYKQPTVALTDPNNWYLPFK